MTDISERANLEIWGEQNRRRNRLNQGIILQDHSGRGMTWQSITPAPPYNDPNWAWGIDMAGVWDGIINAPVFKASGGRFIILKAKDGTINGKYLYENCYAIQNESIPLAFYFWLYPNSRVSCKLQGESWAAIMKQLQPTMGFADYEWTYYNGQAANPNESDLAIARDAYEQSLGQKLGVYTSMGYLGEHPLSSAFVSAPFWDAQYGVLSPSSVAPWGKNFTIWQQSDRWGPASNWGIDANYAHVSDGNVMTPSKFTEVFGSVVQPVETDLGHGMVHIQGDNYDLVRYDPSQVELVLDDSPDDELLLVTVKNWGPECTVVINGGGFLENDPWGHPWGECASNGHQYAWRDAVNPEDSIYFGMDGVPSWIAPYTHGEIIWDAVNFPNKFISMGVKRIDLDNAILDPRTMVGWDGSKVYWFSTLAMTKQQAADLAASYHLLECSNMDGGQSTSMKINGVVINGVASRAVATHLGIRPKGVVSVFTTKGVVKLGASANVKRMDGTLNPSTGSAVWAQMKAGDTVYGDDGGTDITDFVHFYRADGTMYELPTGINSAGKPIVYKVSKTNLTVTQNSPEPGPTPTPVPVDVDTATVTFDFTTNSLHAERNLDGVITKGDLTLS